MRVLLDESMPRRFGRELPGHEAATVRQVGWASISNGELLRRATAAGFDALVTVDRSIEYQQNIGQAGLGIVVLIAPTNRIEDLRPLAPQVLDALTILGPGQVVRVGTERTRRAADRRRGST